MSRKETSPDASHLSEGFEEELGYWRTEFSGKGQYPEALRKRLDPELRRLEFPGWIEGFVVALANERFADERIRGLDVGSGPLSTLAWAQDQGLADLEACDPLGDHYRRLIEEFRFDYPLLPHAVAAEELSSRYSDLHFVFSQNALDHASDIQRCFEEIATILKPGGLFLMNVYVCEGKRQGYGGLHQHDFTCEDGALRCRNRNGADELDLGSLPFECIHLDPQDSRPFDPAGEVEAIYAAFRKLG